MEQYTLRGVDGQSYGPIDLATLLSWARDKRVAPESPIFDHQLQKWIEAKDLKPLAELWQAPASASQVTSQLPISSEPVQVSLNSAFELRPLRLGEILDRTFRLYRQHFLTFFLIALVATIVNTIFRDLVYAAFGVFGVIAGDTQMTFQKAIRLNIANLVNIFIIVPVYTIFLAAMTIAVSRAYLGIKFSLLDSYRSALSHFWGLLGTSILGLIFIFLGFLACIIPGIYLFISYLLVSEIVVLERITGFKALKRSRDLLRKKSEKGIFKNNIWKIAVIGLVYLAIAIIVGVLSNIPTFIMQIQRAVSESGIHSQAYPLWFILLSQVLSIIGEALVTPIGSIGFILLYYDIRIRFEGFDLQLLTQAIRQKKND